MPLILIEKRSQRVLEILLAHVNLVYKKSSNSSAMRERESHGEERKKGGRRKERPLNWYREKRVSLVSALLYNKSANDVDVLLSMWHGTLGLGVSLGHHCPCRSAVHLGHQDVRRTMVESRYEHYFSGDLFVKIIFEKDQNGKITPIKTRAE
jgi:hypothetical protein